MKPYFIGYMGDDLKETGAAELIKLFSIGKFAVRYVRGITRGLGVGRYQRFDRNFAYFALIGNIMLIVRREAL